MQLKTPVSESVVINNIHGANSAQGVRTLNK